MGAGVLTTPVAWLFGRLAMCVWKKNCYHEPRCRDSSTYLAWGILPGRQCRASQPFHCLSLFSWVIVTFLSQRCDSGWSVVLLIKIFHAGGSRRGRFPHFRSIQERQNQFFTLWLFLQGGWHLHFTQRQIRIVAFSETKLLPCCLKGFCSQSGVGCKYAPVTSTHPPLWSLPGSLGSMEQQLLSPGVLHTSRCVTPASLKLDDERKYSNVDLFKVAFKYYIKQQHCSGSSIFHLFGLF